MAAGLLLQEIQDGNAIASAWWIRSGHRSRNV